jgi:1L-myo-inositol 1-phosphate cytidylyltransferase / CDP-L-myo-inositol myo-inositolphosphotransferase
MSPLTAGDSKAQLRLGGVSLVERAVRRLLSLGIDDVIVVVGAQSASVHHSLSRIPPDRVRTVFAERWMEGNGASLAAAQPELVDDPLFVVMTADHLFSDGAIDEIVAASEPAVLVDENPDEAVWSEGTRVRVEYGDAVAFSKKIDEPTVDCGVFTLTPAIFEAQRRAAATGDASLAGAVSRFAAEHRLAAVPMPAGAWWHDIDVPDDVRLAQRSLRDSLGKASDGPISRTLNRPISTRTSMAISRLRPNPTVVSVVTFLVSVAAGVLLALGNGIAGGVLVQVGSIGDGVDGELARLQYRATPWGALLDGVLDRLADATVIAGLAIWAVRDGSVSDAWAIALAVAATAGSMLSMASKDRIRALGLRDAPEDRLGLLLGGRDARLLFVSIAAVVGAPVAGLVFVVVTTTVTLAVRLLWVARSSADR